ncbi:hypothetical protein Clacol_000093 [Clathrus columnatus]|uniref:Uncharacterized protein n=1 Tax=Clathrus columnatus TaxID=1419009 RepID=A0AAV4ZYV2_9AGAM|nr:hypothetical protein Clacol_000093 [Clathrus columnatus]
MILAKFCTSIILLLTLINALPLEIADDPSVIQRVGNLAERQTLPPSSSPATESVNLTSLIGTFEDLEVDLNGIAGVLKNLTDTLRTELSQVSEGVLHSAFQSLREFTGVLAILIDGLDRIIPDRPLFKPLRALPESLKILLKNLMSLEDALSQVSVGDLNSFQQVFTALQGSLKALLVVLGEIIRLETVPSSGNSNGLTEILNSFTSLQGVLEALLPGIGTSTSL